MSLCGGKTGADQIACGEYIVKHIDACGDCHSPPSATGGPDLTKFLAGNPAPFFDIDPTDDTKGLVYPPNLTTLKGQGWTAADLKDAFLNGKRSAAHGGPLVPVMPYSNFHNMAAADADAIAAYILSLDPIQNTVPPDQTLPFDRNTALPIPPVDVTKIPDTTLAKTNANYQSAVLGKYLAGEVVNKAANYAMRILGAYGYSTEYPIARFYRDTPTYFMVEGSANICKMIIAMDQLGYRKANR